MNTNKISARSSEDTYVFQFAKNFNFLQVLISRHVKQVIEIMVICDTCPYAILTRIDHYFLNVCISSLPQTAFWIIHGLDFQYW